MRKRSQGELMHLRLNRLSNLRVVAATLPEKRRRKADPLAIPTTQSELASRKAPNLQAAEDFTAIDPPHRMVEATVDTALNRPSADAIN